MELNQYIDHTLLAADATEEQVIKLTEEAKRYHFFSCCVNGCYAKLVHEQLKDSEVKTCVVVGFPLGAMSTAAKAAETSQAIKDGADEVDMVINIGALKEGRLGYVQEEIKQLKEIVGERVLKVIIETCLLTDQEKRTACRLAVEAGADFVKTSTGFSTGGAKVEDVRLMKEAVGGKALVKASGGVRTKQDALAMVEAGASRIGASSGIAIVTE